MTDLLTPEFVRSLLKQPLGWLTHNGGVSVAHLCRDYLTLWANLEELRDDLADVREELEESRR